MQAGFLNRPRVDYAVNVPQSEHAVLGDAPYARGLHRSHAFTRVCGALPTGPKGQQSVGKPLLPRVVQAPILPALVAGKGRSRVLAPWGRAQCAFRPLMVGERP